MHDPDGHIPDGTEGRRSPGEWPQVLFCLTLLVIFVITAVAWLLIPTRLRSAMARIEIPASPQTPETLPNELP